MKVRWSPHAQQLFHGIISELADNLLREAVNVWRQKIVDATNQLADFPELGTAIPRVCFATVPEHADRLRQIICRPYRIVYEPVDGEIHILSVRHSRMLVAESDSVWN